MRKLHSTVACTLFAIAFGTPGISAGQRADDKAKTGAEEILKWQDAIAAKERERQLERERELGVVIPLDVQLVVSRYQGDKKVSSLPYSLSVNAVHPSALVQVAQLRMATQIPLPAMAEARTQDGKPLSQVTGLSGGGPVQYKEIGTFIDAQAKALAPGRFELHVSVSDTSLYKAPAGAQTASGERIEDIGLPLLRTFTASNDIVLGDGQTKQFMLATDRISGETLRVDVTLRVGK